MGYQLGIDIGTTFTAAAVHRDRRVQIVSLGDRSPSIPSVVLLKEDGTVLTGDAANRRALSEPGRVAREFKRRIGDPTPVIVGGMPYPSEVLTARLLRWVVEHVVREEGEWPDRTAITHPANWGPYKLDLLAQAVRHADLDPSRIIYLSEPQAAAVFYSSLAKVDQGEVVAVYDLGGGTFDAAVVRRVEDGFELLGTPEGIERFGGLDVDAAVWAHVTMALGDAFAQLDPNEAAVQAGVAQLRQECVAAKEALSSDTDVRIPVLLPGVQSDVRLTRSELEAMIRPVLAETITALRRAIRSAEVTPEQVSAVLLVGGSSRIPLVGQLVGEAFGRPVAVDAHPKHAVALGAAVAAAAAAGHHDTGSIQAIVPESEPLVTAAVPIVAPFSAPPTGAATAWAATGDLPETQAATGGVGAYPSTGDLPGTQAPSPPTTGWAATGDVPVTAPVAGWATPEVTAPPPAAPPVQPPPDQPSAAVYQQPAPPGPSPRHRRSRRPVLLVVILVLVLAAGGLAFVALDDGGGQPAADDSAQNSSDPGSGPPDPAKFAPAFGGADAPQLPTAGTQPAKLVDMTTIPDGDFERVVVNFDQPLPPNLKIVPPSKDVAEVRRDIGQVRVFFDLPVPVATKGNEFQGADASGLVLGTLFAKDEADGQHRHFVDVYTSRPVKGTAFRFTNAANGNGALAIDIQFDPTVPADSWRTNIPDGPLQAGHFGFNFFPDNAPQIAHVEGYGIRSSGHGQLILQDANGKVVAQKTTTCDPSPGYTLFRADFDITQLPAGNYTFISTSNDPRDFIDGKPPVVKQPMTLPPG